MEPKIAKLKKGFPLTLYFYDPSLDFQKPLTTSQKTGINGLAKKTFA